MITCKYMILAYYITYYNEYISTTVEAVLND